LAISPIWSIQFKQVVGSLTAGEIALMAISTNLRTPKFMLHDSKLLYLERITYNTIHFLSQLAIWLDVIS
jgi:hypothetical protein